LIEPALFARSAVRMALAGVFAMMACYGGLLFTTALYLQSALHESALRSGLTFAAYAGGFATASLTWSRLSGGLHAYMPTIGFSLMAAANVSIAVASRGGWPIYATALLALGGAGHGAGFGALVRTATTQVARQHAAALSGALATVNQLAIATGIAAAGTLYVAIGRFAPVLIAMATTEALVGTAIFLVGRRAPAELTRTIR
jgi:hypothetical protein